MDKQLLQRALDALTLARSQLDRLWVSHHANRTDLAMMHAQEAIAALREAIATPDAEPVGHLYTIAGVQHCTIERVLPDGPLYAAQPDTESLRKELDDALKDRVALAMELERVRGERDAMAVESVRYRSLMQHQYPQLARMFGVTFGSYTPADDIIRRIGLNIDAAIAAQGA